MENRTRILLALLGALALLVSACDKTDKDGDGGPGNDSCCGADLPPAPDIVAFKQKGETATANFSSGSEQFLVVPYSVSETTAAAIDFEIKIGTGGGTDSGLGSESYPLRVTRPLPLSVRNPALWLKWEHRLALERWQRKLMEEAARGPMTPPLTKPLASCTTSKDCTVATEVCKGGTCVSTMSIKVSAFATTAQTINVDVKKKGTVAAVLVDKTDTVSSTTVDAILDKFEKLIYTRAVDLFGNPTLADGKTLSTDRNADGLIWLVLTKTVKDKSAVGMFVAKDFENATSEPKSNEADILYIDSTLTSPDKAYSTIAHELQHLLGFGAKVYKPKAAGGQGALEALWLDEGESHFFEDACGFGGENVTLLDQELFPTFDEKSLFEKTTDSMGMRAKAFLFVRYLYEQKGGGTYDSSGKITDGGGAAMLKKMHTSSSQGTAAVTEAFGDFKAAYDGWIAALSLDGRGVTTYSRYIYKDLVKDPVTSNDTGVKIRGSRKDDTGATVNLSGPTEEALTGNKSDTIPNASAKFFLLKGKTGKVTVTVTTQESDFRFALIKVSK